MKKILFVALAVLASASFATVEAKGKKDKKKKAVTAEKVEKVYNLATSSDSLSFAAGYIMTDGLIPYLIQQQGVDTAYMADFIEGFRQVIDAQGDKRMHARTAGAEIANQVLQRMMPNMQKEFTDTPDSLIADLFYFGFVQALRNDSSIMKQQQAQELFTVKRDYNKTAKEEKLYGANREAGRQFLAENKGKEGVITTPSGLQYKVLVKGEGEVPQVTDKVKVNYEGRLVDGTVFDSSSKHGNDPAVFRPDQVIKGWTEALTMMPVGSKWQLYIPFELAYGERNMGNIKPFSALIFDVELVGIEK